MEPNQSSWHLENPQVRVRGERTLPSIFHVCGGRGQMPGRTGGENKAVCVAGAETASGEVSRSLPTVVEGDP